MAFTVYGPGIRDNVTLETLFRDKVVEQARAAARVHEVRGDEGQGGEQLAQRQARLAYQGTAALRERQPALYAHQIMSAPLVWLPPQATIVEAWRLFRERRFRHVPVVDARQEIVGILSDRDLLRYAALSGQVPPYGDDSREARTSVDGLYKTKVLTATPDTEIRHIARVLFEQRIGAMPIVDDLGGPLGIITRSDILRALIHHVPLELWV